MTQRVATYGFDGGLDLVSAALAVPPGRLISAMNYEPLAEGYGRVDGFERFDGRTAPSAARFWSMPFVAGVSAITAGMTILGGTSGATAVVIMEPQSVTGSWGSGTAAGTLVLAVLSGTFQDGEAISSSATPRATVGDIAVLDDAPDDTARRARQLAAADYHRSIIARVPGEGPVRGVTEIGGTIYAWRNAVGGASAKLYRSSATGWQEVPASRILRFTAGLVEINEGDTLVGATSATSAVVQRVVRQTGDWGTTAAGFIILPAGTASYTNGEALRVSGGNVATAGTTGNVTFAPGGKFTTIKHNFYGAANLSRIYGADGVSRGFEFDGTVVAPCETGMVNDAPTRVFEIAQHLGFTFEGGSVQFSSIGEPLQWDVITGAGEIGLGTDVTDVLQANESAVVLFGQQKIATLEGRDASSFQLVELTEEAGAEPWTAQRIGETVYLDRRGMRSLRATQAYGNFKTGTLSEIIDPYFRAKRKAGVSPVASVAVRTKSHYRLFWSDGTGLTMYFGRKQPSALPFELDGMQPFCVHATEMPDGTEGVFVGAEDGFVYRLDSGTSFDGEGIRAFAMTPFNPLGGPMYEKRVFKITLELQAEPASRLGITAQFDYGDGKHPISGRQAFMVSGAGGGNDFLVTGGGGNWDSAIWDAFYWSSPLEGRAEAYIDGVCENASFILAARSEPDEGAHVLQAYLVHWSPRKLKR